MNIRICNFLVALAFFCSCEKDIELDLQEEQKLVLLSNFSPDSLFQLYLSTTVPVVSSGNNQVGYPDDAVIQLYEEGLYAGDFVYQPGNEESVPRYVLDKIPDARTSYSITVNTPTFTPLSASGFIPQRVGIEELEVRSVMVEPGNDYFDFVNIVVQLKPAFEKPDPSYFHLLAWRNIIQFQIVNGDTLTRMFRENVASLLSEDKRHTNLFHESGVLFDNEVFDISPMGLTVFLTTFYDAETELKTPVYVELRHVSEDYYLFHKSVGEQEIDNFRESVLATQPVLIHNNVSGGIGNFSGYNVAVDSVGW